jgi:hypothetical protein
MDGNGMEIGVNVAKDIKISLILDNIFIITRIDEGRKGVIQLREG